MIRPRLHTLHTRLLLIVLAAVVPGLLLTAWMGRETRESARLDALNDASRLTLFVAGNGKALFESGRQLLVAMSALPALQNRDAAACRDYFSRLLRNYPNYTNFLAVNPDGTILCSVLKSDPGLSLSDRDWFKRVLARKEFTISGPLPGRIAKKRIVVLAHPVLDRHGEVTAVVVISLDLGWVNRLVTGIPLPAGTTVAAVDRNGRFLTRQPPDVPATEMSIPDAHRIMPALLDHGVDTAQSVGIDGVERLYAFSPLVSEPGGEIFVRVGIPTDVAYAEADRALTRNLALLGSVALTALLLARLFASAFILKPASRMLSAVRRLGAGDLAARVGMADAHGELAELGQAFDSMAQALDERERRLAEAEAKYRGIFEHSMEGIFQTTPEGRIMTANPAMARMLRYDSPEELIAQVTDIGRHLYVDPSRRMELVGLLSACDQVSDFEFEAFRKDGTKHWVSINVSAIRGPDGRVRFIEGFATDVTERKRLDEELKKSEALYRAVVEDQTELICRFTPDGALSFVNGAYCRYFGKEPSQLIGRSLFELVPAEEREPLRRRLAAITPQQPIVTVEHQVRTAKGEAGWVHWTDRGIFDEAGNLVTFQSVGLDVTERRRTEAALRESEERYRGLFDHSPIPIWEKDFSQVKAVFVELAVAGASDFRKHFQEHPEDVRRCALMVRVVAVNRASLDFFRARDEDARTLHLRDYFDSESLAVFREELAVLAAGKTSFVGEIPIRMPGSGERKDLVMSLSVVPGCEATLSRVLVSFVDITERKRMEQALRESEEKHRNLVERAADGIQILQGDRIVFANPALCALVGRSKEDLEGRPFTDIVHPDEIPRIRERVARRLAGEIFSKTAETVLKTRDGRDVHVESNADLIQYNGRPADLVIVRDVTERKRAEALREDVERMIRHDLKTPLNGILNLPQLVMAQHNLNAEQLQLLQMIQEAGERMLRIVNQSLDLFKMEAGVYVLTPAPVDLLALLRTIAAESRRALEARRLSIRVLARGAPAEGRVFTIQSDESLCYSLLTNLVQNALEASPDNGEVLVRIEEGPAWTIEVHNLGAVPEEIRPRFFDKYVTAGKTRGTGLGTYIARLIAEVHGGQIGMRTSEEAGTTVTVTLPRPGQVQA